MTKTMRGIWLATVTGFDWPSPVSLKAATDADRLRMQQQDLTDALDDMVKTGINTVFFQVKPDGTALWNSGILPWSDVLTGIVGRDPGYDPLVFMLKEAYRRGIRVHAWLNPYRVSMDTRPETVAALNNTLCSSPASVYGKGFADKASWRRNNTLLLIKQVSSAVRALRPDTEWGISPAGARRNQADNLDGSDTQGGGPSYDTAYADTRQ